MQILLYILIIVIGAIIGSKGKTSKKIDNNLVAIQNGCLFFLLAVMGYKIGSNNDILSNFHRIGFEAFIISVSCIAFSILFVKLFFNMSGDKNDK